MFSFIPLLLSTAYFYESGEAQLGATSVGFGLAHVRRADRVIHIGMSGAIHDSYHSFAAFHSRHEQSSDRDIHAQMKMKWVDVQY